MWEQCGVKKVTTTIYRGSLRIEFLTSIYSITTGSGFTALYTHLKSKFADTININISNKFYCGKNYTFYREHLDCNGHIECLHGEDAGDHCPLDLSRKNNCSAGTLEIEVKFLLL